MSKDIWSERRQGLEEEFFTHQNRALLEKLRSTKGREEQITDLGKALGVSDHAILAKLLDLGVTATAALPLALVPSVLVAWADGKMDDKESQAILDAASERGIGTSGPAYDLLKSWLKAEPPATLFESWSLYVTGLRAILAPEDFATLRKNVLGRAREVASAAGGFLGMGKKVSDQEERELQKLERTFV